MAAQYSTGITYDIKIYLEHCGTPVNLKAFLSFLLIKNLGLMKCINEKNHWLKYWFCWSQ